MKTHAPFRLWILASALLLVLPLQAQNDSPCNQGRAVEPRIDPRNEEAICLPELGSRTGYLIGCNPNGDGEQYGQQISPVGDVDRSGTADWVVSHQRCDLSVASRFPIDLLLYRGIPGDLPASESGERIGPTEPASITNFLAAGDWDGDSNVDLGCRIQLLGDTSAGNTEGYDIAQLVIFWNDGSGHYSIQDTSRLSSENEAWLGIDPGVSLDLDGDGIEDLFIRNSNGLTQGQVLWMPKVHLFRGHQGGRWGQQGITRTAEWEWSTPPVYGTRISAVDQDSDGNIDISLHDNIDAGTGHVAILYGRRGEFPDVSEVESVNLYLAAAHYSIFSDVTGDHIPELVTCGGQTARVYLGFKGQRLKEQYGLGIDSAPAGQPSWKSKPWVEVWQPNRINSNWFGDHGTLLDLGDGDLDGINDIWTFSWPYLLMYRGGHWMDSLVDGLVRTDGGIASAALLGDIDATGVPTIALGMGNSIRYIKPSRDIPKSGVYRELPEGTGPASVNELATGRVNQTRLELQSVPDPASGEIRLQWNGGVVGSPAVITVHDMLGCSIAGMSVPAADQHISLRCSGWPDGMYFITLAIGDRTATTCVLVRR